MTTSYRTATADVQGLPLGAGRPGQYRRQGARRHLARDALQVLAWGSIALPVAVWLGSGGATVTTVAGALTAVGVVTGLVATASVVLMLWLSARVPIIDRTIGQDRAIALHSRLGQLTFGGLIAHGLFLIAGYALADGQGPVAEFLDLWGFGDFTLAVASIGLLAAVSASSVVAARRKLPFEAWHALHLLTYAAVLAALPHQFSMGGLFEAGFAHWYWVVLWLATFGVVLFYRVFTPMFTSIEHALVVSDVARTAPDVVTITMTGRRVDRLGASAGQYFHWRFLAPGLWWHQHPFSLSAQPTEGTLRISVRDLGAGSAALLDVKPGTRVAFEGPYGLFSDAARTTDDVVMVGIGIGITPVRALLEGTRFAPGRATVILRASRADELYLLDEIEALCRAKGARLYTLVGHRGHDAAGAALWVPAQYASTRLVDLCPAVADADVYVCGPNAAADLVVADAEAAGTPADQIHCERFGW